MDRRAGGTRGNTSGAGYKRRIGSALAALILLCGFMMPARQIASFPQKMQITQGNGLLVDLPLFFEASAQGESISVSTAQESVERIGSRVVLRGEGEGMAQLTLRLMGIVPVKTVSVSVAQPKMLIPGGNLIGVAMRTQGVLLVGTSDVGSSPSPARAAGLRSGDSILAVNGQDIAGAEEMTKLVENSGGGELHLLIERAGERFERMVRPAKDERDGAWRLGAWVRDSTAGVGTLSFIDPETGRYGALGHSISDIDTLTRMLLEEGEIFDGTVADVRKGQAGAPGELVGSFFDETEAIGSIESNTEFGIYGRYTAPAPGTAIPIMRRSEVHTGPATIISQVDNGAPAQYEATIEKVMRQDSPAQRGLVVRITDERLLERTGGIVQGMSGSPIIQDGKLVGAVTHVLVNDPTRGYGIFIENMLNAAG